MLTSHVDLFNLKNVELINQMILKEPPKVFPN